MQEIIFSQVCKKQEREYVCGKEGRRENRGWEEERWETGGKERGGSQALNHRTCIVHIVVAIIIDR